MIKKVKIIFTQLLFLICFTTLLQAMDERPAAESPEDETPAVITEHSSDATIFLDFSSSLLDAFRAVTKSKPTSAHIQKIIKCFTDTITTAERAAGSCVHISTKVKLKITRDGRQTYKEFPNGKNAFRYYMLRIFTRKVKENPTMRNYFKDLGNCTTFVANLNQAINDISAIPDFSPSLYCFTETDTATLNNFQQEKHRSTTVLIGESEPQDEEAAFDELYNDLKTFGPRIRKLEETYSLSFLYDIAEDLSQVIVVSLVTGGLGAIFYKSGQAFIIGFSRMAGTAGFAKVCQRLIAPGVYKIMVGVKNLVK
jgi:hypothetical protein